MSYMSRNKAVASKNCTNSINDCKETGDFGGLSQWGIRKAIKLKRRIFSRLRTEVKAEYSSSFKAAEVMTAKKVNLKKTNISKGLVANVPVRHTTRDRKIGQQLLFEFSNRSSIMQHL